MKKRSSLSPQIWRQDIFICHKCYRRILILMILSTHSFLCINLKVVWVLLWFGPYKNSLYFTAKSEIGVTLFVFFLISEMYDCTYQC